MTNVRETCIEGHLHVYSRLKFSAVLFLFAAALGASEDPVTPPPANQDPGVAERGYFESFPRAWNDYHKLFLERAKQGGIDLLLLGDSIIQGWDDPAQKELWKKNFDAFKTANFGIGGDRTQQILWRIGNGEIDGISPKVVLLQIGINNLWSGDTPERIADGTKKIVTTLRQKLPNAKVLVLGILPAQKLATDALRDKIKQVNVQNAKLDDGKNIRFLNINSPFTDSDNGINLEKNGNYQPDYVHLTTKGYELWAASVKPLLTEMMK